MNEKIRIGFISKDNPHDRRPQSGTNFNAFEALKRTGNEVVWIPVRKTVQIKFFAFIFKVLRKLRIYDFPIERSIYFCRQMTKGLDMHLIESCDALFCPFTQVIADELPRPVVYMSDAVFHSMVGYYWNFSSERMVRMGDHLQQCVLDSAASIVLPCQWAIDCATGFYHQSKEKVHLVVYGANLDADDINGVEAFKYKGHLDIAFTGVDWSRKGGDIAVEATKWLNENGIPSTIHIMGARTLDNDIKNLPFVDYIGFLNKNNPEDRRKMIDVMQNADIQLLPTKAECTGIAFCESSAFGLPAFSHDTGGVSDYVIDGVNGRLLPLGSTGDDFGRMIKECLENGELELMSAEGQRLYHERFNWDVWGKETARIISSVAKQRK